MSLLQDAPALKGVSAGIGSENHYLDLTSSSTTIQDFLVRHQPDHIVCTAGVNWGIEAYSQERLRNWTQWYDDHFNINVTGVMTLLHLWRDIRASHAFYGSGGVVGHFVAISSNSAHIARTNSAAYCASKAALSMALRCVARECVEAFDPVVYGYEPGWLDGTPMSVEVEGRLTETLALPTPQMHRMKGEELRGGVDPVTVAGLLVHNLRFGGRELNGCMFRIDAGEQ